MEDVGISSVVGVYGCACYNYMEAQMKRIDIIRIAENQHGTFGVMLDHDIMRDEPIPFATTLELRWRNNIENGSCIPAGQYICKRVTSPKFGETFEITDVPGRANILLHSGNTLNDSLGCILVGKEFGKLDFITAILRSKAGFKEFMDKVKGVDSFDLTIYQTLLKSGYSRLKL